jgi:hypothetical protein
MHQPGGVGKAIITLGELVTAAAPVGGILVAVVLLLTLII